MVHLAKGQQVGHLAEIVSNALPDLQNLVPQHHQEFLIVVFSLVHLPLRGGFDRQGRALKDQARVFGVDRILQDQGVLLLLGEVIVRHDRVLLRIERLDIVLFAAVGIHGLVRKNRKCHW